MSLTKQETLTEDAPVILDATCSFSKIWPRKATVRIDIRSEVRPDIVMDNTAMKFPDNYFNEIYWDPSHLIRPGEPSQAMRIGRRRTGRLSPGLIERYWFWPSREAWLSNVDGVNAEFYRCIKSGGRLFCKITTYTSKKKGIQLADVLNGLTNFQMESDRATKSKSPSKKEIVHWLTMKPKASAFTITS